MARLTRRSVAINAIAITGVFATGVAFLYRVPYDGLGELRAAGGLETVKREEARTWHEFQFSQPCRILAPRLKAWKEDWEQSGQPFAMTEMEDREWGPTEWPRLEELAVRPGVRLQKGRNCGFEVAFLDQPSRFSRWIERVKRELFGAPRVGR